MADQSTDDLVNQLLTQTTVAPSPSVLGVAAPPPQNQMQSLLAKLKQEQFNQTANRSTPGQYGFLHDAGKQAFTDAGQQIGNMLNQPGGLSGPPPAPQAPPPFTVAPPAQGSDGTSAPPNPVDPNIVPTPGATPQASQANAVLAAKAYNQAIIKAGTPPDQAKVKTLAKMVEWGVPGADTKLAEAQTDLLKNNKETAEASKDTAQGNAATDEISNRAATQANNTRERAQADTRLGIEQQNADTERMKANTQAANSSGANLTPDAIQTMVDTRMTTGKDPTGLAKSGALAPYYNALATRLQQTGDTVGAANAQAQGFKAAGQQLALASKQSTQTQIAGAQIEKNINSLQPIVDRLGGFGSPVVQRAVNQWQQGLAGDKDTAQAVFYINELQSELGRVASGSLGNTPLTDSAKADAKDLINKSMIGTGSLEGAFAAARQSYKNKLQSIEEGKQTAFSILSKNANGSPFGRTPNAPNAPAGGPQAAPPAPQAPPVLNYDLKTGKIG